MDKMPKELKLILTEARLKYMPKGQILLFEGDSPNEVYIVKGGVIKLYDIDSNGEEKIMHLVKSPAILPFAVFSGVSNSVLRWYYSAVTDCEVYVLLQTELYNAMKKDSELSLYVMNWFSKEVHELLVRLCSLQKTNARLKLVTALNFLAVYHSVSRGSSWRRISFPVSHQLLADMVGITRERCASVMKKLLDEHIIRYPKLNILEIDPDRLNNKS